MLFLKIFNISPFIGKGPLDVWHYLFTDPSSAASRQELLDESGTTLRDALLGLAAGTIAAVTCAIAFYLNNEVPQFAAKGIKTAVLKFADYGMPSFNDGLLRPDPLARLTYHTVDQLIAMGSSGV